MRNLGFSGVYSRTWASDDPRTSESATDDITFELSQNFKLLARRAERPSGRVFMRYMRQVISSTPFTNSIRGSGSSRETWILNSGVSLNAF